MSEKIKSRDPEFEILEYIKEKPTGVTITEISSKNGFSRNTVSKYVKILGFKKKIFSKKIGYYNMYFSTETGRDPEVEILDYIRDKPRGATITEISKKKGILYENKAVDACLKLFKEKGFKFSNKK